MPRPGFPAMTLPRFVDAVQKGSLDRYVETSKSRRGTAAVDDAFLAEIEEWRDMPARNTATAP